MDDVEHNVPEDRDGLLQTMVELANDQGIEMTITLQVGAALVTGMLIGRKQYMDAFWEKLMSGFAPELQTIIPDSRKQGTMNRRLTIRSRASITSTCATLD